MRRELIRRCILRTALIIVPIGLLASCAGGSQGTVDRLAPECGQWPSWQDVNGIPSLKYRLRFCGYDETSREQLWEAQFRNDQRWGVSFSFALGDEVPRHRMDLPSGRTRSSVPLLRALPTEPGQTVWLRVAEYCAWATGERSC